MTDLDAVEQPGPFEREDRAAVRDPLDAAALERVDRYSQLLSEALRMRHVIVRSPGRRRPRARGPLLVVVKRGTPYAPRHR